MKHIFKISGILAAVLVLMSISCERDENGPLPDEGMREGVMAYVTFQSTSDELVDVNNPDAFNLDYTIGTLWEPTFQKIQLVVVYTDADDAAYPIGDYAKQYVLEDNITAVPHTGSVTMADIVSAVAELGSSAEVKEGDAFHFFTVVYLNDGNVVRTYDRIGNLQRVRMVGTGLIDALSATEGVLNPDILVPVPCAFNVADYTGTLMCIDTWWPGYFPVVLSVDPDYSGSGVGLIIESGLADGMQNTPVKLEIILKNLTCVIADHSIWFTGNFYGYGDSWISGNGVVNTCAKQLEITVPGWRVAAGSFGGGDLTIGLNVKK
jgi:hypothetical protein